MSPQDPSVSDVLRRWREQSPLDGSSLRELCNGDESLYERALAALEGERTRLAAHDHRTRTAPPAAGSAAPTATTDHPGREWTEAELPRPEVPGYEVLGYLGRGGWGVVYRARSVRLGREVALKLLTPAGVYHPEVRERFTREARALARLDHPNVIPIYDAGDVGGLPYFTMKLVPGGTLAAAATRIGRDVRQAGRLVARVARAVQYLHDQGIVHRDLKPANILLGPNDDPLVADFGMVKWHGDDRELTATGAILGTRLYMAPEQAAGDTGSTGPRSDVWSLGVILYELLAGRRPFDHRDAVALERQVRHEPPPDLTALRPEVPPALAAVVGRCLAKSPNERYPTAAAVADDLERWAAGRRVHAVPAWWQTGLPRRRMVAVGCGLGLTALLLSAAPGPIRSGPAPPDPPRPIAERIQLGEDVVLIGATGLPIPRAVFTDKDGHLGTDADGMATLRGPNYLAAELSDEALPPRFELSAEVSPEPGHPRSAKFGVFAGRRRWESPAGVVDRVVVAGVTGRQFTADQGGLTNSVTRGALGVVWFTPGHEHIPALLAWGPAIPDPLPKDARQRKWYCVSLRVTHDRPPTASCNGQGFEAKSPSIWPQAVKNQSSLLDPRANRPPLLGAGVGVYVLNGTAKFRNVRLKPY